MKYEIMLGILFDLLARKTVTAAFLSEKYEVSVRSVYRYIKSIEYAGIPIYTVRGNGGGFSIIDTFRLSSSFLSPSEYEQTISALSAITSEVPNKTLAQAINKLKAASRNEYRTFDIKCGNLIIDGGNWGDTVGYKSKLKILQTSIDETKKLLIKYHDRNGTKSERIIEPHVLVFKQGLWYVYAFCNLRNEFRFFKTGRIEYAKILDDKFVKKEIGESDLPLDFWNNAQTAEEITMEISNGVLSDVEEWLGVENVKKIGDKNIASASLPYDDGLVYKIMSFGDGIKVLSPAKLSKKIKETALAVAKNY